MNCAVLITAARLSAAGSGVPSCVFWSPSAIHYCHSGNGNPTHDRPFIAHVAFLEVNAETEGRITD